MADTILPLECLAELTLELQSLQSGNVVLPPWLSQTDVPRLINETAAQIQNLEDHIRKYGNTWETEYAF